MRKEIKTRTKIIITILIAIAILLIFPKFEKATTVSASDSSVSTSSIVYVNGETSIKNKYLYCIQKGQTADDGYYQAKIKYTISDDGITAEGINEYNYSKTSTDTSNLNFAMGLVYILSTRKISKLL